MKLNIDPDRFRRFPSDVASYYEKATRAGAPDGALDDARRPIRIGLVVVGLFFGLFLLWAAVAPLSAAAVAPGVVTVSGDRQTIQPVNGGVISAVLVREGQTVRPGQELIRLNGVASGARLQQFDARRTALLAAEARLIAERDNLAAVAFPQELMNRASQPFVGQALRNQSALFERRYAVAQAERRIADARIAAGSAQAAGARRQLALIQDELADIEGLYNRGFAPRSRLRALQRAEVDLQTGVAANAATQAEAELELSRQEEERARLVIDQLRTVQEQLAQTNPEAAVVRQAAERDLIRAPFAGKIVGLQALGPGSVIGSGQAIMDLLPSGRALVVEARVRPQDADEVRVGSHATVRLTSLNPHGRSSFDGEVTILSADRLTDPQTGEGYYLATVAVDSTQLAGADIQLQPGVPATVNITTRKRTFLDYLFRPLGDAFGGAMRED
jgi:HlyD family type I secretion membrane fusion protein